MITIFEIQEEELAELELDASEAGPLEILSLLEKVFDLLDELHAEGFEEYPSPAVRVCYELGAVWEEVESYGWHYTCVESGLQTIVEHCESSELVEKAEALLEEATKQRRAFELQNVGA